ncbi:hypothetical protein J1614_007488 [Plenodomus biglobosus]|nr:hypothetical protein J1614_007488 [Plenodomus biglobosus]
MGSNRLTNKSPRQLYKFNAESLLSDPQSIQAAIRQLPTPIEEQSPSSPNPPSTSPHHSTSTQHQST